MREAPGVHEVQRVMAPFIPKYEHKVPAYQHQMLVDLSKVWRGPHAKMLDVGGGTGIIAELVKRLFDVSEIYSVDVEDRYFPGLSYNRQVYSGDKLPFDDGYFDAAMINNVMHHVPPVVRPVLMKEIERTVRGPIYIKDHLQAGLIDKLQLTILDAIGNIPYGGQVSASYLSRSDWHTLAAQAGRTITEEATSDYRSGLSGALFPNKLEITYRLDP